MELKFKIERQLIRCTNSEYVVEDSVNFVMADFVFDEENWNGYIKTVTFTNIDTCVSRSIILDESLSCVLPWEVINEDGHLNVYIEGVHNDVVITTARMIRPLKILKSGKCDCSSDLTPTPDVYQQLLSQMVTMDDVRAYVSENRSVVDKPTRYDFPSIGNIENIYKAHNEKQLYQWDEEGLKYVPLNDFTDDWEIEEIYGGNAHGDDKTN